MKSSKLTILICGLISIVVTVLLYVLIFDNIFSVTMRWLTLLLLVLAETILTVKAIFLHRDLISSTCIVSSVLHVAASLLLAIIFVAIFKKAVKVYLILNVILFCILAIVDVIILFFGKNASEGDKKLAGNQAVMHECLAIIQNLIVEYGSSEHREGLESISELIRYSDNTELTGDEVTIMSKLGELETALKENGETIPQIITEISNTIKIRTIKMKNMKRGGY